MNNTVNICVKVDFGPNEINADDASKWWLGMRLGNRLARRVGNRLGNRLVYRLGIDNVTKVR